MNLSTCSVQKKILVVDDSFDFIEIFSLMIEKAGHNVSYVNSFAQAMQLLEDENFDSDVIFIDFILPDGRGPQLAEKFYLRTKTKIPAKKIIILSNFPVGSPQVQEALTKFPFPFETKPEVLSDYEKLIKKYL